MVTTGLQTKAVRIIATGGTLDKVHDARHECLGFTPDGASVVPEILLQGRCYFPVTEVLLKKDSLHFSEADRAVISQTILKAEEEAIVITHGTGTLGVTARYLEKRVKRKTVVITGALRPFSLGRSDASFNLGGALVAAQLLSHGTWAVMNGRVFPASGIIKDLETGRFDL